MILRTRVVNRWASVSTRLPLHQNKFAIVFDNRIRFVGLAEKTRAVFDFICGIGDFVPDDRRKIVESDFAALFLDCSVKRNDCVSAFVFASRKTDIAHDADEPSARNECSKAMAPHFFEFDQELFVSTDRTHLPFCFAIFL